MKAICLAGFLLILSVHSMEGQKENKLIREGIREYDKEKYGNAEISFRKALDKNQGSYPADYNVGNTLYKQNKFKEAAEKYTELSRKEAGKDRLSDVYHNLGNSYLNEKQFDKSIEAYKNALRLRPDDEDTRYNLAYAMSMLKQQQQQQQDQKNDQKDQDKKDEKKNDEQDKQKDQNKNEDQKNEQQQQQQPQKDQLTKQEAEQILEAIQNEEKKVQEKVEREKAKAAKVYTEKDW